MRYGVVVLVLSMLLLLPASALAQFWKAVNVDGDGPHLVCPAGDGDEFCITFTAVTYYEEIPLDDLSVEVWVVTDSGFSWCGSPQIHESSHVMAQHLGDGVYQANVGALKLGFFFPLNYARPHYKLRATSEYYGTADQFVTVWQISSPDVDGNGVVNLSDWSIFTSNMDPLPPELNLYPDPEGVWNISDTTVFSQHFGHSCP
ncbi:MAG: hypothetical protein R6X16_01905 [Anaerolineae bacterium]